MTLYASVDLDSKKHIASYIISHLRHLALFVCEMVLRRLWPCGLYVRRIHVHVVTMLYDDTCEHGTEGLCTGHVALEGAILRIPVLP